MPATVHGLLPTCVCSCSGVDDAESASISTSRSPAARMLCTSTIAPSAIPSKSALEIGTAAAPAGAAVEAMATVPAEFAITMVAAGRKLL